MLRQHTKQHFKRGLSGIMAAVMTATLIPSLSVLADDEIKTVNYSFLSNTFKVSGTTVNINGDIDSNSDLNFYGNTVSVAGNCCYMGNINNYCGNLSYNKEIQKDESTAFPDIGDGLNYIFNFFDTDSYKDGVTFNWQETLDMGATYSNEGIAAYGRTISTKDIIGAKNSISFNSTDLTTVANAESYIYSSNGDISIQANTVDLNGLIYAPNGKVLISAGNIDFEGLIIADEIEVNGNDVTLSASPFNSYNIDFLTNIINDARIITVADYYLDESKMTLSWDTNQYGNNFTIWASYDGGDYIAIADTDECTYDYIAESGYQTIDFYVEQELLSGNKMISNTVSLTANENGEYEVYMEDSDGDGLCDPLEDYLGTDKNNANTDDDGLTDYEELYYTQTDPLKYDSDDNGICDADEDIDEDGLSFRQELDLTTDPFNNDTDFDGLSDGDEVNVYGTDPLKKDTDDDGLIDGKEPEYSCDPLNPDSNYDGILDGDDTYTVTKKSKESDSKVSVELTIDIPGKSIGSLSIDEVPDDDIFLPAQMPGFIGNGFDFYVDCKFEEATMKYTFDESLLDIENFEPAVYYCDVVNQKMVLLEEQVVDLENCTVTAKTTHFSRYILPNKTEFEKIWDKDFIDNSTDEDGNKVGMEIALVIDSSGSMGWNDLSGIRKDAAKEFVDSLRDEDKAAIIDFDHYAYTYQGLTNNKKLLYNAINKIDDNGGTSLSAGMSMALDNLLNSASDAKKIIIMLTDGVGDYDSKYTTIASNNEITVYTIGLGYDIDSVLLNNIATATGGKYYHADKAEDLKDNFEEVQEDIGTKDTDGDTLPDVVEENLYWFNGVSLSAANKPSDIDLFLGFKSDDPNTFYKYLNDGQLVREYKQISENRYEAVLKDGVIWDIPSFQEKLNENKKEIVDKYVEEVCEPLTEAGNILASDSNLDTDQVVHHMLSYHSGSQKYKCEYCEYEIESPEFEDNYILDENDKFMVYSLNAMKEHSNDKSEKQMFECAITAIREEYLSSINNCNHAVSNGSHNNQLLLNKACTEYSASDVYGNYLNPQLCTIGYSSYKLTDYNLSIEISDNNFGDVFVSSVENCTVDWEQVGEDLIPIFKTAFEKYIKDYDVYITTLGYDIDGMIKNVFNDEFYKELAVKTKNLIQKTYLHDLRDDYDNETVASQFQKDFVSCAASLIESLCPELKAGHFAVKLSIEIGKFLATRIVNLLQCATELPGNKEISIIYHAKDSTMVFESQMTSQFAITFVDNLKVVNNVNDYISNKLSNFGSSSNVENGCFSIKNNGYTMSPRFGNQNSVYHFYTYNMLRNIVINPEYRYYQK